MSFPTFSVVLVRTSWQVDPVTIATLEALHVRCSMHALWFMHVPPWLFLPEFILRSDPCSSECARLAQNGIHPYTPFRTAPAVIGLKDVFPWS